MWVENLPVDTYREESLLLLQSGAEKISVFGFRSGGVFAKIADNIGNFDLSAVTVLPNYGLLIAGAMFVKIEVSLTNQYDDLEFLLSEQTRIQVK